MPYTSTLDLETLELRFPRARLRGTATSKICVSHGRFVDICEDHNALEKMWVRKGRDLRIQMSCLVDGQAWDFSMREHVEDALRNAKMWKQLGLRTSRELTLEPVESPDTITIHLHPEIEEQDEPRAAPTIYDICYRTPAKDIAPPSGVRTADLDVVKISLLISCTNSRARARKRKKTDSQSLLDETEVEDMLFPSQSQQGQEELSEADAVLATIDAAVRMNMLGDVGMKQPLASGLTAKFVNDPRSLMSLAPAVFARPALTDVATRAALLPTVAHALSSSLVTQARSPALREKLRRLCHGSGLDTACDYDDGFAQKTEASWRFEAASARLWQFLQHRMRARPRTLRLDRVGGPSQTRVKREDGTGDEDLFASQDFDEVNDEEDLFASQVLEDWGSDDDDDLFASQQQDEGEDEDLFASQEQNGKERKGREIEDSFALQHYADAEDVGLFSSQEEYEWDHRDVDLFTLQEMARLEPSASTPRLLDAGLDQRLEQSWLEDDNRMLDLNLFDHDDGHVETEDEDLFEAFGQGCSSSTPTTPLETFGNQGAIGPAGYYAGIAHLLGADSEPLDIVDDSDDDLLLDLKLDERMSDE